MSYPEKSSGLFQEPVAEELLRSELAKEQQRLEEERRDFEREKKEFYFRKKMEEKRLAEENRLFQMKWKVLEGERRSLAKEKQDVAVEKERYHQRDSQGSHFVYSGNNVEAEVFFSGVCDELALKKRYKELIKIYHPDNLAGDTVTLQMINKTYDFLKKQFSA